MRWGGATETAAAGEVGSTRGVGLEIQWGLYLETLVHSGLWLPGTWPRATCYGLNCVPAKAGWGWTQCCGWSLTGKSFADRTEMRGGREEGPSAVSGVLT